MTSVQSGAKEAVEPSWRCFHCDEVCTSPEAAEHHFGRMDGCTPICQVAAETYRKMEREVEGYRSECDADTIQFYSLGARHATALREAEQAGYDKGLADGRAARGTWAFALRRIAAARTALSQYRSLNGDA